MHADIAVRLRRLIDDGELTPGDRLPPERALAELFSVSRNTVREAIKALAESGVVESRRGAGTYVVDMAAGDFIDRFAEAVTRQQTALREAFHVRKLVEPEIAGLAARNADPDHIERMEAALLNQKRAIEAGQSGTAHDQEFHRILAEASGNAVLLALVTALHDDLNVLRSEGLQTQVRTRGSHAAHLDILDAVRRGAPDEAETAMRKHLSALEAAIFQQASKSTRRTT